MKVWIITDIEAGIPVEVFDSAEKARDKMFQLVNYPLYRKDYVKECISAIQEGFEYNPDEYGVDDYSVSTCEIH